MSATKPLKTCHVLVLAPSATSAPAALDYMPFNGQRLRQIFETAAENARETAGIFGDLTYDQYEISEAFFFGGTMTRDVGNKLVNVPSAIFDCSLQEIDTNAWKDIDLALIAFHKPMAKSVHKISRDGKCSQIPYPGKTITSEPIFISVLENHLWAHQFASLADEHPR